MFPRWFQVAWWIALLAISTLVVLRVVTPSWTGSEGEGPHEQYAAFVRYAAFVLWIVLLLVPIFSEISVFGFGVKRELRALEKEVKRQDATDRLYWLGNDLASLRFQALMLGDGDEAQRVISWQGKQALVSRPGNTFA